MMHQLLKLGKKIFFLLFFFFFYMKRVLTKGKQKQVLKNSRLSRDPVKRTVGEKKHGMQVQSTLEMS